MDSCDVKSNSSLEDALAQLDISGQSQGPICRLPKEMLRAILAKLEVPYVLRFRLVNKRWNVLIEDISRDKKRLVVMSESRLDHLIKIYLSELLTHFNGHLKLSNIVFVERNCPAKFYDSHFSGELCTTLAKLFPRIEQFCTGHFQSYDSAEFNSMLQKWSSSLTTLSISLSGFIHFEYAHLCAQINQLPNLKKLYLNAPSNELVQLLAPTWPRLEHFSGWSCKYITKILPFIGEGITSVGVSHSLGVTITEITKWHQLKAQFVANLERLCLTMWTFEPQVWSFICKHFTSLQMLSIEASNYTLTASMIKQLAQLSHLTELLIDGINISTALDAATAQHSSSFFGGF